MSARALLAGFVLSLLVCLAGAEASHAYALYRDYREIPGVTSADIRDVEALKAGRSRFTCDVRQTNEAFILEDGSVGGFSRYLCDWLSGLFGIPFEPGFYSPAPRLETVEADFTCGFSDVPERRENYFIAAPLVNRPVLRFRMKHGNDPDRIARWRKLHYGFPKGFATATLAQEVTHEPFETRFYDTMDEGEAALRSGAIDAFVMDTRARAIFDGQDDIMEELFFPLTYSYAALITARPELEPIIRVVEKFLASDGAPLLHELYARGIHDYRRLRFRLLLTNEERAYIAAHAPNGPAVRVAMKQRNYPVSFLDESGEGWQGIAVDVLREIQSLTGLTFEPTGDGSPNAPPPMASDPSLSGVPAERSLRADQPYTHDRYALISRIDRENVRIDEVPDYRVGAIRDDSGEAFFRSCFPDAEPILVSSRAEAFDKLDAGALDLFMASGNALLDATNHMERPTFKLNYLFDDACDPVFAFREDERALRGIVSKAQRFVDTGSISNEWRFRTFDYRRKAARELRLSLLAAIALMSAVLAALLALFRKNRRIRADLERMVEERTDELKRLTVAANAARYAKGTFLSRISREMCHTLDAIAIMAREIGGTEAATKRKDLAGRIDRASKHLQSIIDDILEMSSNDSGTQKTRKTAFNLEEMLDNISAVVDCWAAEKSRHFLLTLPPDVPRRIVGDEPHIAQVLANFLSSIFTFSPTGSVVRLDISHTGGPVDAPGEIRLRFAVHNRDASLSQEEMDGQLAETTGTGLPLAIQWIEAMGGTFEASAHPGDGTTLSFTISVLPVEEESPPEQPHDIPPTGAYRVLVVDDVEINREIAAAYLEDALIAVDFAENGRTALECFGKEPDAYDLILMDIQMPEMNGLDATLAIRAMDHPHAKTVPILAMTANVFEEDIKTYLAAGMNDYIGKPLDPADLLQKLAQYLAGS